MCLYEGRTAKTVPQARESLKAAVRAFLMAAEKRTANTSLDAVTCNLANTITEIAVIPDKALPLALDYFNDAKLTYAQSLTINRDNVNTMTAVAQYLMRRGLYLKEVAPVEFQEDIELNFAAAAEMYQKLVEVTGVRDYLELLAAATKYGEGLTSKKFIGGCNSY